MPPAAFAIHQLRYYLTYGASAGTELQRTGHSYLHSVVPWLVALIAVALGAFLWSLGRAFAGQRTAKRYTLSLGLMWLVCSLTLIGIFSAQEFLEGLCATGHPAGLAGIFGYGGWWAIPASACVGLILAALFHGALWVLGEAATLSGPVRIRVAGLTPHDRSYVSRAVAGPRGPVAGGRSSRGPPALALARIAICA